MLQPIPDTAVRAAATVRQLRAHGLTEHELAGPLWHAPYRGVRVWGARDLSHPRTRIDASVPLLPPAGAIGGWAAAYLADVVRADGRGLDGKDVAVDHLLPPALRLTKRAGIRHRRGELDERDTVLIDGIRVTRPSRTAIDMARWAPSLTEAVVALDMLLHAKYVSLTLVQQRLASMAGRRGIAQARSAAALADPGAESPWESRLRMLWMLDAGLPRPLVNPRVRSAGGTVLGRVDLLDEEAGLVLEYDGEHHRELGQHTADNVREERLERVGLRVIRFTVLDVLGSAAAVHRLRHERALRLGRDTSRERWRAEPRRGPSGRPGNYR